jgi:peroxiredoxin
MRSKIVLMLWGLAIFGTLFVPAFPGRAADRPPVVGQVMPEVKLPIPEKVEERQYLGLDGTGTFTIPQIRADVVIIEIFSMYCPFCQKEAHNVNELYRLVDTNPDLNKRVKLIGIGAGNSPFEVNTFRRNYAVPFPLFSDIDFSLHEAFGKARTPFFIAIKINENGTHKVIYSEVGSPGDAKSFLELIMKQAGLKKGS